VKHTDAERLSRDDLIARAHRDHPNATSREVAARFVEYLEGQGGSWARTYLRHLAVTGATVACRSWRLKQTPVAGATKKGHPVTLPAFVGRNRLRDLTIDQAEAHAAQLRAAAKTMLARASAVERSIGEARESGARVLADVLAA
jgi:hypothetical protein